MTVAGGREGRPSATRRRIEATSDFIFAFQVAASAGSRLAMISNVLSIISSADTPVRISRRTVSLMCSGLTPLLAGPRYGGGGRINSPPAAAATPVAFPGSAVQRASRLCGVAEDHADIFLCRPDDMLSGKREARRHSEPLCDLPRLLLRADTASVAAGAVEPRPRSCIRFVYRGNIWHKREVG